MRRAALLMLAVAVAAAARAFDVPKWMTERFEGRTLLPVEGVWLWNSGALVAVEADSYGALTFTLMESPDPLIDTPVRIGAGRFGGESGTYDVELTTSVDPSKKRPVPSTANFVARLTGEGHLSLTPYSTGIKVDAFRLIPYLLRLSVKRGKAPAGLDGAVRVWPSTGTPEFPVVL